MATNNISTNILRDENKTLNYIVTPNAVEIYKTILQSENRLSNSFTIIGNYGTGKSTFLWALEKNLKKETLFFSNTNGKKNGYNFIKLVGENRSISESFKNTLNLESSDHKAIINSLESKWKEALSVDQGLFVIIDEFGKFLEFINKNGNTDDLYLIQLVAEWANDQDKDITLIISLHQDFTEYSSNLNDADKKEWEKVKGRFKEILFNEPIEQLIFFASKQLESITVCDENKYRFELVKSIILKTNLFSIQPETYNDIVNSLYPLDWLSTNVLVNSLQRYGQNERSLFTFLNDLEGNNLYSNQFYGINHVFDYLTQNLSSVIGGYKNPHRNQWQIAFRALERAELLFDTKDDYLIAAGLIKSICLLNIFAKPDSLLNDEILIEYFSITNNYSKGHVEVVINSLYKSGIIRFYKHSNKINFLEGTDLDIEQELANVSKDINADFNVEDEIIRILKFPILSAKRYSFKKGSPRYFEFRILKDNDIQLPEGAIDGYINMIFETRKPDDIKILSMNKGANIFVLYQNFKNIHDKIYTILKLEKILKNRESDFVAKKLINQELSFHQSELEKIIISDLFIPENNNVWYFDGSEIIIENRRALNSLISDVCSEVYFKEPILKNELINREYISSQIATARKRLLRNLLHNSSQESLGFEKEKFPPEKAIYISLFHDTGIHSYNSETANYEFSSPKNESFKMLWGECDDFLQSSISSKRNLYELYESLVKAPFKLKKGFLDLWIVSYLIINKEKYALFHEINGFVPYLDEDILELILKNPKIFSIKSYELNEHKIQILESYKELLQIDEPANSGINSTLLKVYASFLKFHMTLNDYTKTTNELSKETMAFRDAIKFARDPEEALFYLFPQALGFQLIDFEKDFSKLEHFISKIQVSIREIRNAYSNLLNRIEYQLIDKLQCESSSFEDYKEEINTRFHTIKVELLQNDIAIFFRRLLSPFDHRDSWIKSVADIALQKPIDKMSDADEAILMHQLDLFCDTIFDMAEIHNFSSNGSRNMVSISILNARGENTQKKIVIDHTNEEEISLKKASISSEIAKLDSMKRKQLLYELLLQEFENN